MKMAKKSKKPLMEILHEEEESKTLFNEAKAEGNNDKESENAQTDTGVSGDVKDAEYGPVVRDEPAQTADPVKASDEILATLNDYKSELPADLLTGGPEFEAKPRKRGRRSKAEIEKEKAEQAARSEEHTSELQSRENLVCRLLLEKKKYERDNYLVG